MAKDLPLILVVDGNRHLGETVCGQLESLECRCEYLASGMAALCRLMEKRPGLLLVDMEAPELDGLQLCALLREQDRLKQIPVVLLAQAEDIFLQAKARALGVDEILVKPFGRSELENIIASRIRHAA